MYRTLLLIPLTAGLILACPHHALAKDGSTANEGSSLRSPCSPFQALGVRSLVFDGATSEIDLGMGLNDLMAGDFCLTTTVVFDDDNTDVQVLLSNHAEDDFSNLGFSLYFDISSGKVRQLIAYLTSDTGPPVVEYVARSFSGSPGGVMIEKDVAYDVTIITSGMATPHATLEMYIDGSLADAATSAASPGTPTASNAPLCLGFPGAGSLNHFNGLISALALSTAAGFEVR